MADQEDKKPAETPEKEETFTPEEAADAVEVEKKSPGQEAAAPAPDKSDEDGKTSTAQKNEAPAEPAEPKEESGEAKPKSAPKAKKKAKKESAGSKDLSLDDDAGKPKILKAKGSKNVHSGIAHVLATFNNTIVSITDPRGAVIGWSSAGKVGFKGSRKSTAYAAQTVAQDACRQAMSHGLKEVEVRVKGPGAGRESAVRAMQAIGLEISVIRDVTPVPHNGCRPPKQRRV